MTTDEQRMDEIKHGLLRAEERYANILDAARRCQLTGPLGLIDMLNDFVAWTNICERNLSDFEIRGYPSRELAEPFRKKISSMVVALDNEVLDVMNKHCSCRLR